MGKLFIGSLDLSKIDKKRIVSLDKNGKPFDNGAKYYNIVIWLNDETDQYGNIGSIQEGITKEERDSGLKSNYIGNFKNVSGQTSSSSNNEQPQATGVKDEDDQLPF